MKYFFISARPKHWAKNILVFAAPLFAFNIDINTLVFSLNAFLSFCLVSSGIYFLNDVLDFERDRLHPVKKNRPIASRLISRKIALICSIIFLITGLVQAFITMPALALIILAYSLIQVLYCLYLKNIALIDILCISSGFLLRALAGGINDNDLSPWFILSVGFLALFLAVEKRKAELRYVLNVGNITRKVLERYSLPLLNRIENIVSTSSIITYSLWASGPELNGAKSSWMLITIPFVLSGIFRYQLLSDPKESGRRLIQTNSLIDTQSPEEVLIKDKGIRISVISWFLTFILVFKLSS